MSASPVVVPLHRAAFANRAPGWQLDDALDSVAPPAGIQQVRGWMASIDVGDLDASEQIDAITELEKIKSAAAAAQARLSVAFTADRVDEALAAYRAANPPVALEDDAGEAESRRRVRAETAIAAKATRSAGSQIALARRESPYRSDRFVGMAKALVNEMPHSMDALEQGQVSEWGAMVMVRGTAVLGADDRAAVDALLGPQLDSMSPKQIDAAVRREAAARDAAAVVRRREEAVKSRRVSVRPAPDGMAYLTLLTGMKEAVAAYASLHRHAQSVLAGTAFHAGEDGEQVQELPEGRGRGAIMADTMIARLLGRPTGVPVPVDVNVVITDRALFGTGDPLRSTDEPARVPEHGMVPAPVVREWLHDTPDSQCSDGEAREQAAVWLRRLYTSPDGRDLVAMDSRRRTFSGLLRRILILRDDACRTPFCDSPIGDGDHVKAHHLGGATSYTNGAGLCTRCNQTKESPGWRFAVVVPGNGEGEGPHTIRVTRPTGHEHHSAAPPLMGSGWAPPEEEQPTAEQPTRGDPVDAA